MSHLDSFPQVQNTTEVPKFARFVRRSEIEANEFNLNIPRYIDSQAEEDIQDIAGHLQGGIPDRDLASLSAYWEICPSLKSTLFQPLRSGYSQLVVESSQIKTTIAAQEEFISFMDSMTALFVEWRNGWTERLKGLELGFKPKSLVWEMGESLLACYQGKPLVDAYGIYQHLLDYWGEVMQDDCYLISDDGWRAETRRLMERKEGKEGKVTERDKGWVCDLVPKGLVVARYFASEQAAIAQLEADLETVTAERTELEEEHSGEEGYFAEFDKINKISVAARLKEIKGDRLAKEEQQVLTLWQGLASQEAELKRSIKEKGDALDRLAYEKYPQLSIAEVQVLVVEDKWMAKLQEAIAGEVDRISQGLTQRVKLLAERYAQPLPQLSDHVKLLENKVGKHLEKMGFVL